MVGYFIIQNEMIFNDCFHTEMDHTVSQHTHSKSPLNLDYGKEEEERKQDERKTLKQIKFIDRESRTKIISFSSFSHEIAFGKSFYH